MSTATDYFDGLFAGRHVMAILRGYDPPTTVELCRRAWEAGVDVVEVPVQSPDAMPSLEAAVTEARRRGRTVGAGTVTTPEQVADVVRVGAAFAVAPGMDRDTAAAAADADLPYLPGVATASEVQAAGRSGLTWVKAFPASVLTPAWVAAQLAPFPHLRVVATGGVDAHNAPAFLAAGARVVGVGSALEDPDQLPLLARL